MIIPARITLEGGGIRLEPLTLAHHDEFVAAASDGQLWELWYTAVPKPEQARAFIENALATSNRLTWVVRELGSSAVVGSTSYHDIVPAVDRVEIGYTFYSQRWQRTYVNSTCKLLLLQHAFDELGCKVVGLRTDRFNLASQRAIEALGAHKDGVLRHHHARKDGSVRDTVMYSILAAEWPDVRRGLELRLQRHRRTPR